MQRRVPSRDELSAVKVVEADSTSQEATRVIYRVLVRTNNCARRAH